MTPGSSTAAMISRLPPQCGQCSTSISSQPLAKLRMALNQDQPVENSRFYANIEAMTV
jgi:hypothetical protein